MKETLKPEIKQKAANAYSYFVMICFKYSNNEKATLRDYLKLHLFGWWAPFKYSPNFFSDDFMPYLNEFRRLVQLMESQVKAHGATS